MKKLALRHKIRISLILILALITILFLIFAGKALSQLNGEIIEANQNMLDVYHTQIINELNNVEEFLLSCQYSESIPQEDMAALNMLIAEDAGEFIKANIDVTSFVWYHAESDLFVQILNSTMKHPETESRIKKGLLQYLENTDNLSAGWFVHQIEDNVFWIRAVKNKGSYYICLLELKQMARNANIFYDVKGSVVFQKNGKPLINQNILNVASNQIIPALNNYIVVQAPLAGLKMTIVIPFEDGVDSIRWLLGLSLVFVGAVFMCAVLIMKYFAYSIIHPVNLLIDTMKEVRGGKTEARIEEIITPEFEQMRVVFNEMMDEITMLQIEKYEQKLQVEKSKMDAIRLQIRPHFYQNCLKSLYSLAQQGTHDKIQEMILLLSSHLRYVFDIDADAITLKEELNMCENYVNLYHHMGIGLPCIDLTIEPGLLGLKVPPVSFLTLVENSFKYGMEIHGKLSISISAHMLEIDRQRIADIIFQDNGKGFESIQLERLNANEKQQGHIGIVNMISRFKILYGEEIAFCFRNVQGAQVEIMIPIREMNDCEASDC